MTNTTWAYAIIYHEEINDIDRSDIVDAMKVTDAYVTPESAKAAALDEWNNRCIDDESDPFEQSDITWEEWGNEFRGTLPCISKDELEFVVWPITIQ